MISNLQRVPISTLSNFLLAVAAHPHSSEEVIADFAGGLSRATAKRTLPTLIELGLIQRDTNGKYHCPLPEVKRGMASEDVSLILRKAFHGYRPFEAICEGLLLGENESEATRRAALILSIDDPSKLNVLVMWGEELGIFSKESGTLKLTDELLGPPQSPIRMSPAEVTNESAARLHNASLLGRDANNFLDETDRRLLATAQLEVQIAPEDAAEKAGQALEDYLREIAKVKLLETEAKACNGAGQVGSMLVGKGIIHSHHNQIVLALSTVRNMKAHHKDKKTLQPWHISKFGAEWTVIGVLNLIKSIHSYVFEGKQIL